MENEMTRTQVAPRRVDIIKDYVKNLNDEEWRFLQNRLGQRLGGDLAEAVSFLEKTVEVDRFLGGAPTATDYYNRLDHIEAIVQGDSKRRNTVAPRR